MSVPTPTCVTIDPPPSPLTVRFPGGLSLQSTPISTGAIITDLSNVQSMLAQLGPALAGLQPVFTLIDTVAAIKDTITAIPGLIVGDLDTFLNALERVVEGVGTLATMAPPLAVPAMVSDVLGVVTAALESLVDVVDQVIDMQTNAQSVIDQAQAMDPPSTDLEAVGNCQMDNADLLLEHAVAGVAPIAALLTTAQTLLDLVPGMPTLPGIDDMTGQSAEQVRSTLTTLIEVLESIRIPGA